MGRPKKNVAEQALGQQSNNALAETKDAQQREENKAGCEAATQAQEKELPFELESYALMPVLSVDNSSFLICANTDIEVRPGRMLLLTGIILKDGFNGLIMPTADNAAHGLPVETGYRLLHSDVLATKADRKVKLVLRIADDTMTHEQTSFGSRSRNMVIPQGTPLAELMIFKA